MKEPKESVLLITGTSRGIGLASANHYLTQGWRVVGCSRSASAIDHPNYFHSTTDVSQESEVVSLLREIQEKYQRLDAVINNAAIFHQGLALLSSKETLQTVFETNVFGTFMVCRESAKLMQKKKYGRIINLGSIALTMKIEGSSFYASSKAAILEMTKILAKELALFNITCNMVAPGLMDTAMYRDLSDTAQAKCLEAMAIKQMSTIEDLSQVTDFLLSKESSLITGQHICLGTIS